MVEYIEKEAAQKIICGWCGVCKSPTVCDLMHCDDICPQFAQIPAAGVREVVRAKWKRRKGWERCVCSLCSFENEIETHFCPNCGADMRGGADGIH